MSKGFSRAIVLRALILLAIAMALPTVLLAAGSNMSADPNASVAKGNTAGRSVAQPARSAPVRSSARTPAAFTPQMPLSEAIDILRNCTTPPLNLVVLWRSLDGAGVYKETPIGLDGLPGLKVRQYLDMLVLSLSAGASDKIAYVVQGGVITIGTTTALPKPRLETRVYDVRDLTAPPANYALPPMGYAGMYGNGPTGSY
ncbi:MAG: hypothetical protein ACM3VT_11775, partial [Solirubrobacterales bacterium]